MRRVRQSWCRNDFISPPTAFSAVKQASAPPRPDQLGTTDEFRSAHGLGSTHNLGTADDLGPRGHCAAGDVVVEPISASSTRLLIVPMLTSIRTLMSA